MMLLNPKKHDRFYPDAASRALIQKTIKFFETRGAEQLRADYHAKHWYSEFLEFVKKEQIFATLHTPPGEGNSDARWDTWRNCEFAEVLGFYGLQYWYAWQVSVLGLGPLLMTENKAVRQRCITALKEGGIFAFGLSEKEHGADIYSTSMTLSKQADGSYRANGRKYYIGNGNKAALVSVFGKMQDSGEYVFFAVEPRHDAYKLVQNVVQSQSYVSEFELSEYPITDNDILARGPAAWDMALNTVNIGKYNLGWASIGICTHAFYEAIAHASQRRLYNMYVTDFPHVKRLFVEAYARLVAMKVFALRAADYMRVASAEDRRYLLFNPMVKMKVTTEGERVINALWDVIAAKGFEKNMYFEEAAVAIRALPKLEGTVHVNIALIVKFMANYFFNPREYPEVTQQSQAAHDAFLFDQGSTRGLGHIQFHDYQAVYDACDLPNVRLFKEQILQLKTLLATATPDETQRKDIDFLLSLGDMFALVVYGQLILENSKTYQLGDDLVDQIFDFLVADMSALAVTLHAKASSTEDQMALCMGMIKKPHVDAQRFDRVWQQQVLTLKSAY